jgi:uncharacterized protein
MLINTIPGIFGSDNNHWQTHWENSYGFSRIEQADWSFPVFQVWENYLIEQIEQDPAPKSHILVAHSMGCLLTVKSMHTIEQYVKGIFLVAPPDLKSNGLLSQLNTFDNLPLHKLSIPGYLVYSENDPYATPEFSERLGRIWGLTTVNVGLKGHINSDSNLGDWDEGYALFEKFMEKIDCSRVKKHQHQFS